MVAQQPLATGTLGGTPLANLLIYVLDRKLTGTLVIEDHRHRKSAIGFVGGAPVKVKLPETIAPLAEVLVGRQVIDTETALATLDKARTENRLHGEVLVGGGHIDRGLLEEALGEQLLLKVEWLCALRPESMFGYYDGQDFLKSYGGPKGATAEPLSVVWHAVRLQADVAVMDATLARIGTKEVRMHPRSRAGRFGFSPKEKGVIDVLRAKPQSLTTLLASGLLPEAQLKKLLFVLIITRHLDLGGGAPPIGVDASSGSFAPAARSSAPPATAALPPQERDSDRAVPSVRATPPQAPSTPATPSPEMAAFRAEIRSKAETIGSQNYYQILGVELTASASVIQGAFFQLAKRWHPDRIGPEFADLKELSLRVFARISEAHQVLANEEQRHEYERLMREGGAAPDEQEMVQRVLRAATAFQKAEVLARRGNLDEAEKHAASAVENDPEQAEYFALYADILSQNPQRVQSNSYADVVKMVNDAKKKQPDNKKVRLYRARVLKRSGEHNAAHREFRGIVEEDAHNVEAAREVRLFEMRRGKKSTDPKKTPPDKKSSGGKSASEPARSGSDIGQLFGKFFKR